MSVSDKIRKTLKFYTDYTLTYFIFVVSVAVDTVAYGPKAFDINGTMDSAESMNSAEQENKKMKEIYGEVHKYLKQSKYIPKVLYSIQHLLMYFN